MLCIGAEPLEPVRIVVGAGVKPDIVGDTVEVEPHFGAARRTEIDDEPLSAARGRQDILRRLTLVQPEVGPREHGLDQIGGPRCSLTEFAVAEDNAIWLASGFVAQPSTKTPAFMLDHGLSSVN